MMRIVWSDLAKSNVKEIYKIVYKAYPEDKAILIANVFDTRQNPTKLKI